MRNTRLDRPVASIECHRLRIQPDTWLWTHLADRLGTLSWLSSTSRAGHLTRFILLGHLNGYERRHAKVLRDSPGHLHNYEASTHSQNGEDGIIAEIFRRIGERNRVFVEIGAADGEENCTALLADQGWKGLWVEGDPEKAARGRRRVDANRVTVVQHFVDRDSIGSVLKQASVPLAPDLLVIDVDGNDYWIWKAVAACLAPRVVVIEYNAVVGPYLHWVMPYNPRHTWNGTAWHGAGLAGLVALGTRLGYRLVACDSQGVNAFFVRADQAAGFSRTSARRCWVPPLHELPYGHPLRRVQQFETLPLPVADEGRVTLKVRPPRRSSFQVNRTLYFEVIICNGAPVTIGDSGDAPTHLGYWWTDGEGARLPGEPGRCIQPWMAESERATALVARVKMPMLPGRYSLWIALVQEGVRWMDTTALEVGTWEIHP